MMSLLRMLIRLVFNRFWLIVLGLLALCAFIWIAGPLFAFADYRPLESEQVRLGVIAVITCLFLLWAAFKFWKRRQLSTKLFRRLASLGSSPTVEPDARGVRGVKEIETRFSNAMASLRTLRVSSGLNRLTKRYVYELPWYIIIGAPGSGKTTAILNSGMNFPLLKQTGRAVLRGAGGTRNCDWWITDESIIIDTAGRYTLQAEQSIEQFEWLGFLKILKTYRSRQPINGVILTLSIGDLIKMDSIERIGHFNMLRSRLEELHRLFGIVLPVYLWVTKADLLVGFKEFFSTFNAEQRDQVWGMTLPYNERNKDTVSVFASQWKLFTKRLYLLLDEQLARETEKEIWPSIYWLPQQIAAMEPILQEAIGDIFIQSSQVDRPLLRGVYFTSATQEAAPAANEGGALDPEVADKPLTARTRAQRERQQLEASYPTMHSQREGEGKVEIGKRFFIHDLFLKLIFKEKHLAGRDIGSEKRHKWLTFTGYASSALILMAMVILWLGSWNNNRSYLAKIDENVQKVSSDIKGYSQAFPDLARMIDLLGETRHLGDTDAFSRDAPLLPYRWGLFQGKKVGDAANESYEQILRSGLLPILAKRLETQVDHPPVDSPEYLYNALKAYLMLYDADHFEAKFLRQWISADTRRYVLPDAPAAMLKEFDDHLVALFPDSQFVSSPYTLNGELVERTRLKLANFTPAQRIYLQLRARLEQLDLPEFNLLDVGGPQAANVFTRQSKLPLNRGVAGLFTYRGYWDVFDKQVNKAVLDMLYDDGWVMGQNSQTYSKQLSRLAQGKLANEVRMLYLRDYDDIWERYLADVQLISSDSLGSSIQRLRVLAALDSPLPLFLRAVVKETTLLRENRSQEKISVLERATQGLKNTQGDIERVVGPLGAGGADPRLERIVDERFAPLRQLVGQPGAMQGAAPLDTTLKMLNDYYGTLVATDAAIRSGGSPPPQDAAVRLRAQAGQLPQPLRAIVDQVATTSSDQTTRMVRSSLGESLNASIGDFCRRAIEGRFPLKRHATLEVAPEDFSRMFAPGGAMDEFFNKNLSSIVNNSTWRFKDNIDGSTAEGNPWLSSFKNASVIRDVFFRGGSQTPSFRLDIKTVEMDPSITSMSLNIDGTVVHYNHGPERSQSVTWPGPGKRNVVLLQISDAQLGESGMQTEGPWALHRFFDKLRISPGESADKFLATYNLGGKKIVFEVSANSVQNPFRLKQLQEFSCPSQY